MCEEGEVVGLHLTCFARGDMSRAEAISCGIGAIVKALVLLDRGRSVPEPTRNGNARLAGLEYNRFVHAKSKTISRAVDLLYFSPLPTHVH